VAGIEVDAEARRFPSAASALRVVLEVVGDLGRDGLERELDALGREDVDDGAPALREVLEPRSISAKSFGGNE
jgi:hypothetical protein